THVHADHISPGRELAETTGATYLLHEASGASMPHRAVRDGEHIELGNVLVEVLHMPGHTPEHIALLVTDRARANEPWFVFTGHALMVGDMGRTELATSAADGARAMFATAQRFAALPDHIEVLPGAFAGSVCGRGLSGKASSTIGFERRFNRAFRVTHLEPFVHLMLLDIPAPPPNAAEVRRLNLGVADQLSRVAS
ncbi:MAG: MBL fold metallo-hydrolase, partial [Gemmatimonadota bacterium]